MALFDSETFQIILIVVVIGYFLALIIKNATGVAILRGSSQKQKEMKIIDPHALQRVKHDIIKSAKASLPTGPRQLWLTGSRHISRISLGKITGLLETNSIRWISVNPRSFNIFNLFTIPLSRTRLIATHKDYCSHPTSPDIFIRATAIKQHADTFWHPAYIDDYDDPMEQEFLLHHWKEIIMEWKAWMLKFQHIVQTDLGPRLLVRAMNPAIADRQRELYPGGPVREMTVDSSSGEKFREAPKRGNS